MIERQGVTPNSFAASIGYKRSQAVYDMLSGKARPSFEFFERLLNSDYSEKIDIVWLITGRAGAHPTIVDSVSEASSAYMTKGPPVCALCNEKERIIKEKDALIKALQSHIDTLLEGQKRKAC